MLMRLKRKVAVLLTAALLAARLAAAGSPETVHVTYHVKSGKLVEFLAALREHHPACLKLGLVLEQPHLILSGKEDGEEGKPVVIEILTWKDSDAPDSVPHHHPEIKAIWESQRPC
jgi:uncharacterized protein YciI